MNSKAIMTAVRTARGWDTARWAPIPLRLIVGYGFLAHGYAKLVKGPDVFAGILHAIGVPAPHLMAWLTILIEVFGGVAVLLGAFVPLVSVPMAAVLLVAMFTVHLPYGFSSINLIAVTAAGAVFGPPGYETDLLYLACLAALVAGGSGPLAIGGDIANPRVGPAATGRDPASATRPTPAVAWTASPSLRAVTSPGQDVREARMLSITAQTRQRFS
jgi:putative oxidoreductase